MKILFLTAYYTKIKGINSTFAWVRALLFSPQLPERKIIHSFNSCMNILLQCQNLNCLNMKILWGMEGEHFIQMRLLAVVLYCDLSLLSHAADIFFPMKTSTDNDDDISFTHLSWGNLNCDGENNLSRKTLTWLKYGFRIHSTINWDPISLLRNPDLNRFQMQIRDAVRTMSNLLSDHRSWSRGALNCKLCIGPCLGMVMARCHDVRCRAERV